MPPRRREAHTEVPPETPDKPPTVVEEPPTEPAVGPQPPADQALEKRLLEQASMTGVLNDRLTRLERWAAPPDGPSVVDDLNALGRRLDQLEKDSRPKFLRTLGDAEQRLNARADYKAGHIFGAFRAIMNDVRGVGKHGQMTEMGRYKYRKYDDLKRELGEACRAHGVGLQSTIHNVVNEIRGNMQRVQVLITYRFTSLVDGTEMSFDSIGESCDRGDKATGKAMTMALKTALDQAFMLAAEDIEDPDAARPEAENDNPYGNGTMVPDDRWGTAKRAEASEQRQERREPHPTRDDLAAAQHVGNRFYRESDPVPAGGHKVGDRREVAGQTFVKHSDGPGYPNDSAQRADAWDSGPVAETRSREELAAAAMKKLNSPALDMPTWERIAAYAQEKEIMDVMITTPTGEEMQLKRHLVALGRTL